MYQRFLDNQTQTVFVEIVSKYQYGFRKWSNAKHCLVSMVEKWMESGDNGAAYGTLMRDLYKEFYFFSLRKIN